jgi:hypothetical protein
VITIKLNNKIVAEVSSIRHATSELTSLYGLDNLKSFSLYQDNQQLSLPQPVDPLVTFKEDDNSFWGVRYFRTVPPNFLMSPTSCFIWETHEAVATDFFNSGAVRGHIGFHAAWPGERGIDGDLPRWWEAEVDHSPCNVKALVLGYGDVVTGSTGWRSSKMKIVQAMNYSSLVPTNKLAAHYQDILWIQPINNKEPLNFFNWLAPPRTRRCLDTLTNWANKRSTATKVDFLLAKYE